jgi:hypothetical protein
VSDVRTHPLGDRYGAPRPAHRRSLIAASGLLGAVALGWVVWVLWIQVTPAVQSSLRTYDVVDSHTATAEVVVKTRDPEVDANCLVRATGADKSVVGELNFDVSGVDGTTVRTVSVRTEREASSVVVVGCTADGQDRPR